MISFELTCSLETASEAALSAGDEVFCADGDGLTEPHAVAERKTAAQDNDAINFGVSSYDSPLNVYFEIL